MMIIFQFATIMGPGDWPGVSQEKAPEGPTLVFCVDLIMTDLYTEQIAPGAF